MAVGEKLRTAREEKGISLAEVENETKIRRKYILAMENEEFDVLPGKAYVKGFIRNYARFLGADGDALVREYDDLYYQPESPPENPPVQEKTKPASLEKPSKSRLGLFVIVAVLLAGFMFYWLGTSAIGPADDLSRNGQEQNLPGDNGAIGEQEPAGQEQEPVTPGPDPAQRGVNVELHVTVKDCWMQVVVDNSKAFEGLVGPGITKEFRGNDSVWLKLGDAGAVRVVVNGNEYGFLGELGEVVTKTFEAAEDGGNT